jgi:hypothetical protein
MADASRSSGSRAAWSRAAWMLCCACLAMSSSSSRAVPEEAAHENAAKAKARAELKEQTKKEERERAKADAKRKALAQEQEKRMAEAKAKAIAKARERAKAKAKARGKKDATAEETATEEMSAFPLFITYDPAAIGIGGPCPGDNEISRGECSLVERNYRAAREHFLDAWNTQRSPFAAMRLGDLAWLEGETTTALLWYEQVNGSTMMQRMANLRRCEIEPGCGVTGRNVPSVETFGGPFGDEALLRTARIYTRSGFPELAALLLVQGNGRGCDVALSTCQQVAALALEKSTTNETLALSLAMRRTDDAQDEARAIAARHLGLRYLADDLEVTAQGEVPEHRVTPQEEAAAARAAEKAAQAKLDQDAPKEAATAEHKADEQGDHKEAEAKKSETKDGDHADKKDDKHADKKDGKHADKKDGEATEDQSPQAQKDRALARKTKRDRIDDGVKRADESLDKTRRLLEVAGGALPLGGPR